MKKFVISVLVCVGCGQPTVKTETGNSNERAAYEQGLRALAKNNYQGAAEKFTMVLNHYTTTKYLVGAYYNLGLSLEGLNKYSEAAENYKKVIELEQGKRGRDEADALYRLSICYEVIGDDTKMILALVQLQERPNFLNKDLAQIELPARLAAAYARQGNIKLADEYNHKAEAGLKLRRRTPMKGDILIWLPKTLYSMGHIASRTIGANVDEFKNHIKALQWSQSWLLRCAELGEASNSYSKKGAEEILQSYNSALQAIETVKASNDPDMLKAAKFKQDNQRAMAGALDYSLQQLKDDRLAATSLNSEVSLIKQLFEDLMPIQKKIDAIIQSHDVQDQNTNEAKSREGLKH